MSPYAAKFTDDRRATTKSLVAGVYNYESSVNLERYLQVSVSTISLMLRLETGLALDRSDDSVIV